MGNEEKNQHLALELKNGHLYLTFNYGNGKTLSFVTSNAYNNGEWVKVESARALRNGVETGVLRVVSGNQKEELMDTISLSSSISFQMEICNIYLGGVPPGFNLRSNHDIQLLQNGFLGNIRSITVSNPGSNSPLNPLYAQRNKLNLFHGVKSNCERDIVKEISFKGDGYAELTSQPLRQICNFGFTFNTMQENCLLVLSAFKGSSNEAIKFYSVSIMYGKLALKFSSTRSQSVGKITSFLTEKAYNDGKLHTVTILKQDDMIMVYVDDQLVTHSSGLKILPSLSSSPRSDEQSLRYNMLHPLDGSLYIGGLPTVLKSNVEASAMAASTDGLIGTIKDMTFMDDNSVRIISMNDPRSIKNAEVGRIKYFKAESNTAKSQFQTTSQKQIRISEVVDLNT